MKADSLGPPILELASRWVATLWGFTIWVVSRQPISDLVMDSLWVSFTLKGLRFGALLSGGSTLWRLVSWATDVDLVMHSLGVYHSRGLHFCTLRWEFTLWGSRVSGNDFGSGHAFICGLDSKGPRFVGLESRATALGSGHALSGGLQKVWFFEVWIRKSLSAIAKVDKNICPDPD